MSDKIEADSSVVVYFAGHGDVDDNGYFYLTSPADSTANLGSSKISHAALTEALGNLGNASNVLLVLDTCRAGAMPAKDFGKLGKETGFYMFAASAAVESALDGYDGKNGVFAYAFLEALRGAAANFQGIVSVLNAGDHLLARVGQLADEKGHEPAGAGKTQCRAKCSVPIG